MHCYLLTVAYDGSNFAGWAKQPNKFTAQGYIEDVLNKIFLQRFNILAGSRTDKGVHALDQKFILRFNNLFFSPKKLFNLLNRILKPYILVKKVTKVDNNFHPLRNVFEKEYRYFINTGKYNIFQKKYCWEYNLTIKVSKLNKILQVFCGKHNFFNYCHRRWIENAKENNTREIILLKSWKKQNIVVISIVAKGFLRYQVRAIIGEAISCYRGKQTITDLQQKLINSNEKNYKYKNLAPAEGLYLWKTKYCYNH